MEESLQKTLLIQDIKLLVSALSELGFEAGSVFNDLDSFTAADLLTIKRDLRDLLRTMGGKR